MRETCASELRWEELLDIAFYQMPEVRRRRPPPMQQEDAIGMAVRAVAPEAALKPRSSSQ